MKNVKFLFLVSFLLVSLGIHAQNLRFGLKTGPTLSFSFQRAHPIAPTYVKLRDPSLGFHLNGFLENKFSKKMSVQLEPGFIRQAWKYCDVIKELFHIDYWQMPVILGYYFRDNLVASLGVDIGYHFKKREYDVVEEYEFGGLVGMRYDISDHLGVGLRYSRAFIPYSVLFFTGSGGRPGSVYFYSHCLQFSVAYRI